LLGWYNAGTDQKSDTNLFGCVQLPEPAQCFGTAEAPYGQKERDFLVNILENDKSQSLPWPKSLQSCFSTLHQSASNKPLYGSPMLDGALGKVDSVSKALVLLRQENIKGSVKTTSKTSAVKVNKAPKPKSTQKDVLPQFDSILPPEAPSNWVQCDDCRKWRRVAWHIDDSTLPDYWTCSLNTWDVDSASCAVPQDPYDADIENTVQTGATVGHVATARKMVNYIA